MKTTKRILIGIVLLIAVFIVGVFIRGQMPTRFTIAVTGKSGLPFSGVIKADGVVMSVSGVVPTNFVATGRSLDCRFEKQPDAGVLGVCVTMSYLNGASAVTSSESDKGVHVAMTLHSGSCNTF